MKLIHPNVEQACLRWLKYVRDASAREKLEKEIFHSNEKSDTKTGAFLHLYTHEWLRKVGYTLEIPEPPDLLALNNGTPQFYVEITHRGPSAVVDGYWDKELWVDEDAREEIVAVEIPERQIVIECLRKKQNKYTNLRLPLLLVCGLAYRPYDITEAEDDLNCWFQELARTEAGEARYQRQISGFLFAHPISPSLTIYPKVWFAHHKLARHPLDESFEDVARSFSKTAEDYR